MAIAVQVILSFGHAHREGFRSGGLLQAAEIQSAVRTVAGPGDPASPPAGPAFEYCAICAVIKMGAAAVPPEAPASSVPTVARGVRFAAHAEVLVWNLAHQLFQARAPPIA